MLGTLLTIALAGPITAETSVAGVRGAAERTVNLFAAATAETLGFEPPAPAVEVRNTANLAYFDPRPGTIVSAHWPTLGSELRAFFLDLADTEDGAGGLFVALFDEFLMAHEMGHWVQRGLRVTRDRSGRAGVLQREAHSWRRIPRPMGSTSCASSSHRSMPAKSWTSRLCWARWPRNRGFRFQQSDWDSGDRHAISNRRYRACWVPRCRHSR